MSGADADTIDFGVLGRAIDAVSSERKKAERLTRAEDALRQALAMLVEIGPIRKRIEVEELREAQARERADTTVAAQASRASSAVALADEQIAARLLVLRGHDDEIVDRERRLRALDEQLVAGELKLAKVKAALAETVA